MKKPILSITLILLLQTAFCQMTPPPLEEHLASVDIGFIGSWFTYERAVGEQIAINAQLGLEGGFYGSTGDFNYALTPTVRVEPRWYYNFNKRVIEDAGDHLP